MAKMMLFVDGTWLYLGQKQLAQAAGKDWVRIDYGKLAEVLARRAKDRLGIGEAEVVRKCLFGSYPTNCDKADEKQAERRKWALKTIGRACGYDVELYPVDFRGGRLRRADRDEGARAPGSERCVDVALASSMLFFAALPFVYDVAVVVIGDLDFLPALWRVRELGKRVVIASIKGCCPRTFFDQGKHDYDLTIKDAEVIWLDDIVHEIRQKTAEEMAVCALTGKVIEKNEEERWGVIRCTEDGNEYRFGEGDLAGLTGMTFDDLWEGEYMSEDVRAYLDEVCPYVRVELPVQFEVKKKPAAEGNMMGEAQNVSPVSGAFDEVIGELE